MIRRIQTTSRRAQQWAAEAAEDPAAARLIIDPTAPDIIWRGRCRRRRLRWCGEMVWADWQFRELTAAERACIGHGHNYPGWNFCDAEVDTGLLSPLAFWLCEHRKQPRFLDNRLRIVTRGCWGERMRPDQAAVYGDMRECPTSKWLKWPLLQDEQDPEDWYNRVAQHLFRQALAVVDHVSGEVYHIAAAPLGPTAQRPAEWPVVEAISYEIDMRRIWTEAQR